MKVLITSDSYLPRLGGAEIYALKLGSFLQRDGHDVRLFTTEENPSGIETSPFPVIREFYRRNPIIIFHFLRTLYRECRKADVVNCIYSYKIAAIVGIFKLFIKKPMVVTLEGLGTLDMPRNSGFYSKVHSFYRWFSIRQADMNIAACLEFVDIAKRYTNTEKIVYIPNALDIDQFNIRPKEIAILPEEAKGKMIVATIRRLVPKNGIQFLIEASPFIVEKFNDIVFFIIGWGRLENYLKERVRALKVDKYFHFAGRIENEDLPRYLNLADVVVFPSTAEATSIACLESMALGKPIIASNVGGYPEMVQDGHNGHLVDLTDSMNSNYDAPMTLSDDKIAALANAVVTTLSDKGKLKELGKNSRRLAETKFSWREKIKDIEEVYEKAIRD